MRRTFIIPTALLLSALALTGCSASDQASDTGPVTAPQPMNPGTEFSDESATGPIAEGLVEGAVGDGALGGAKSEALPFADRQVVTTGYVTVTVDQPMDAAADAIRIVESSGGRVDGRSEYAPVDGNEGSATLTLRIPANTLTATLDKLKQLGAVQEVSLNAADVTMETQDLDARITALSASVDRLLVLLATATDTDTLITLETAISDRQAQLESLESQRRYYADQVSLSTVTLNLVSDYISPAPEPDNFLSGLAAGWNAFVGFFAGLLVALGVLLPWLIFLAVIAAVIIVLVRRGRGGSAAGATPVAPRDAAFPGDTPPSTDR